jgi:Predicted transcriptional regulators
MVDGLFRIGEAAEICGMTAKSLRFYEKVGLVSPGRVDPRNGYRYYSADQLIRLDMIRSARALGLGIKEIKEVLQANEGPKLLELVDSQERKARAKIEELGRAMASFRAIRSALADSLPSPDYRGVYAKDIHRRRILSRTIGAEPTVEEVSRASASLERAVERLGFVNRYETGILMASDGKGGYRPSAAFIVVETAEDSGRSGLSTIPAGEYVCVRYDEKNAEARQRELGEYMCRLKLEPSVVLQADLVSAAFGIDGDKAELQVLATGSQGAPRSVEAEATRPRG